MTQNFRSAHSRDNMNTSPLSRLVTFLDFFFRRLAFTAIFLYRSSRRRFEDTTYTKYMTQVEIIPLVSQKHDQSCIYFLSSSLFKGSRERWKPRSKRDKIEKKTWRALKFRPYRQTVSGQSALPCLARYLLP